MRKLKIPGRVIGRKHTYLSDFASPDTSLPDRFAQPEKILPSGKILPEVPLVQRLANLLGLNRYSDDLDIDGRDKAGMKPIPPDEATIRKRLFLEIIGHKLHCSGLGLNGYWLSYRRQAIGEKN